MKMGDQFVVVRTYSAGVHVGTLVRREGKEITLRDARRIWSWKGANTLHEIANRGVGSGSRVSQAVQEVTLTEAIEILSASDEAKKSLEQASWT